MDALRHTEGWTLLITNGAYELANIPLPGFVVKYEEKRIQVDVNESDLPQSVNAKELRKIIREELDDTHLALECSSVNCNREASLENKAQGKLDLSPRSDGTGPSIWVDAYLCDVCMSRVREGYKCKKAVRYHPCDCGKVDMCTCSFARKYRGGVIENQLIVDRDEEEFRCICSGGQVYCSKCSPLDRG